MGEQMTVWHPHLPGMTRQVPVDDLEAWLSSGWLESARLREALLDAQIQAGVIRLEDGESDG